MAVVVAFAGRRVDPQEAEASRFPPRNVDLVRERIREQLQRAAATSLVSSAACGADLLALEAAGALRIERVVVLPWDRQRFRAESVVDRGDAWGPIFDRVVDEVEQAGGLRTLAPIEDSHAAFAATNEAILDLAGERAIDAGDPAAVVALVAWDGQSRGPRDLTRRFMERAKARGVQVVEVSTIA
jgi:hypothetical protein